MTYSDSTSVLSFGAPFIGMVVAAILYGVSCIQTLHYFMNYDDTWCIKLPVIAVTILDILHQALITYMVYTHAITDWGKIVQHQALIYDELVGVLFTGITAFIVQSFLTLRIWRLSGQNVYITGTAATMVFGSLLSLVIYLSRAFKPKNLGDLANVKSEAISITVLGAATDVLLAGILCTLLHLSRTGFRRSNAIIDKLITFTVNTGLLTSLCALASLISLLVSEDTFLYASFFYCLGRLYTNSLLATLNARKMLRGSSEVELTSFSIPHFATKSTGQPQNTSIKIDTTQACNPGDSQSSRKHEKRTELPDKSVLTYDNGHEHGHTDEEKGPY